LQNGARHSILVSSCVRHARFAHLFSKLQQSIFYIFIYTQFCPTLQNVSPSRFAVRCFGTEDRRPPAETIPATSEVYEFIIFRGNDIKDLNVLETPAVPAGLTDPAIVSVSSSSSNKKAAPSATASSSVFSRSLSTDDDVAQQQQQQQFQHSQPQRRGGHSGGGAFQNSAAGGTRFARDEHSSSASNAGRGGRGGSSAGGQSHQQQQQQAGYQRPATAASTAANGAFAAAAAASALQRASNGAASAPAPSGAGWSGPGSSNYINHRAAGSADDVDAQKGDYDFAASNAKFSELTQSMARVSVSGGDETADASADAPVAAAAGLAPSFPPVEKKYDKKSSFFDDISTACSERAHAAPSSRQNMRKIDSETFGAAAETYRRGANNNGPDGNNGNGGGNYRGGGYRGGARGGFHGADGNRHNNGAFFGAGSNGGGGYGGGNNNNGGEWRQAGRGGRPQSARGRAAE
jgi:protein LSM14